MNLPCLLLGLRALLPAASAHVPHDEVVSVGFPAALDNRVPWLLLAGSDDIQMLLRSDDAGRSWTFIGGEPLRERLVGVAVLDDGTFVAASSRALWGSTDGGATWERRAVAGPIAYLAGGAELVYGGADGAWEGHPDGLVRRLPMPSLRAWGASVEGRTAVDGDGGVWVEGGAGWGARGTVSGAVAVNRVGATVYVGTPEGAVRRLDGAVCGALGAPAGAHPTVVRIAASPADVTYPDGVLLVVTGEGGPYRSTDGCATFEDLRGPLDPVYDGPGSASAADAAAVALGVNGARWVQAGWAGFALGDDASTYEPVLVPPDYTRGIAFSPGFADDRTVYVGGYAAGVLRTADGGATWEAAEDGLGFDNVQRVSVSPADDDEVLSVTGHRAWRSADGGARWTPLGPPVGDVSELFGDALGRVWAFGTGPGAGVAVSGDHGASWARAGAVEAALAGTTPGGIAEVRTPAGPLAVLAGGGPTRVLTSSDTGLTWTLGLSGVADHLSGPVGWPADAPTRIVVSDDAGVYTSDDGATWSAWSGSGDDGPRVLAAAGSSLFLATRAGRLYRSDDGGLDFADLGVRLPAPVHALAAAPGFDAAPALLIGTHDGVYTLDDPLAAAPTLLRWSPYQRVDDSSAYFACVQCGDLRDDARAGLGALRELGPVGEARATLRGTRVEVYGSLDRGAEAELWVDGAFVSRVDAPLARPGRLAEVDGLADGWHDVAVVATAEGVAVDALVASSDGARFDPGAGGCASAPASASAWPVLAALVALGRRRGRVRA